MSCVRWVVVGVFCGLFGVANQIAVGVEPEERGAFYEDDAWYDITEWFDGNDYNPTDERWDIWDDETYSATDDRLSSDRDSDLDYDYGADSEYFDAYEPFGYDSGYGYLDSNTNDWFYDYYDDGYAWYYDFDSDGTYDKKTNYYDFDEDGLYDMMTVARDTDDDGLFDTSRTYSFNTDSADNNQAANRRSQQTGQQASQEQTRQERSQSREVTGRVKEMKTAQVRGVDRQVVQLETEAGQKLTVDLGPARKIRQMRIQEDDQLTVRGPRLRIGQHRMILAQQVTKDGSTQQIQRNQRQIRGEVVSSRTVQVLGQQHTLAMIDRDNGEKVAVDLGPTHQLRHRPQQGDTISVQGIPVKARDRRLVMAQRATIDGQTIEVNRDLPNANASPRGQQSERNATSDQEARSRQGRNSGTR